MPFFTKDEINQRKALALQRLRELLVLEDESKQHKEALLVLEAESQKIRDEVKVLLQEESDCLIPLKLTTD